MADESFTIKDNWKPEGHSYPRLTATVVFVAVFVFVAITSQDYMLLLFVLLLAGTYIFYSICHEKEDEISFALIREDWRENDRRELKNKLVASFLENGIIDDNTLNDQVEVYVLKTKPVSFQCQLTQQGRRLEDIEQRLEQMCPVFNADHCSITRLDNVSFILDYIAKGQFDDMDEPVRWADYNV